MALFEIFTDGIKPVSHTSFGTAGVKERTDLQRLLRDHIEVIAPDVLVIAEEFGNWADSRRRIDLLGVDRDGNLVVVELKRTEDGGHMELQALRYAAMVSPLTLEQAMDAFRRYLESRERDEDPEQLFLEFLGWDELDEDRFAQNVRIVLLAADFSRELTSAVMWLSERDIDIRCVRMSPYEYEGRVLVDVQQILPLPEAADYQVQVREKKRQERKARESSVDFTRYDLTINGETYENQWKRNAILHVVKGILVHGKSPEEIARVLSPVKGPVRTWFSVPGEFADIDGFREKALQVAGETGRVYDERRWHTKEDDLMIHGGQTHVFSNQWGRRRWSKAMGLLEERFPEIQLRWEPTAGNSQI